ncbi:hypothetical protein [Dyadobacter sp. CY312]|uniref:hypothetical protein n=1 Tax=Dyadobacter sp. CY312 TaxID=2907303 RepID=UPI001F373489|nr:hypothetical protein [Dyadobacter sp. CY312]MCE7039003.1 hypothetical protein [Dyadobacter sp. CY312]
MAAKYYISCIILVITLGLCNDGLGQVGLGSGAAVKKKTVAPSNLNTPSVLAVDSAKYKIREKVLLLARKEVGVVERTGKNDHPRITVYHKSVSDWLANYRPAQPYCASFVNYIMKSAGVKVTSVPNPARARDWFLVPSRTIMTQQTMRGNQRMMKLPERGAVVGYIFYGNAISHIEILDRIDLDEGYIYCVGANTSGKNAANTVEREGQGVYFVKRKIKMFYKIADVI